MRRLLLSACLLASTAAHARVLWRGDFSTGDLSQWNDAQSASPEGEGSSPSRLAVVRAPDVPGGKVLRVRLKAGDVAYNVRHHPARAMGNRSELVHVPLVREGDERWYRVHVLFPSDYAVNDGKGGGAVFLQWHHLAPDGREPGSPPLLLTALTNELRIVRVPELGSEEAITVARIPQRKDRWRDLLLHVRFSADPGRGLIEAWCDGRAVVSTRAATLFPGFDAYLKMGLYRRPSAREENVVYFAGMVEGTRREDVEERPGG